VRYVADELAKLGYLTRSFFGKRGRIMGHRYTRITLGAAVCCLRALPEIEVLVVHRAGDPVVGLLAKIHKRQGGILVFDIDDATYLRWNILTTRISQIVRESDLVIVGSHAIADHLREWNHNVHILPSGVDTALFRPSLHLGVVRKPVIGWLGDGPAHVRNLELIVEPLQALANHHDFKFKMVSSLGSPQIRKAFAKLASRVEVDFGSPEWVDIHRIPELVGDFDVSVMPLSDDAFNRSKAGQKLLETMSMEIPVVASDLGENSHIVTHDVDGFLVSSVEDWEEALRSLIDDPTLRQRMGRAGRSKILERYSKEVCGSNFARIVESVGRRYLPLRGAAEVEAT